MIATLSLSPAVDRISFVDDFREGELFRIDGSAQTAGGKGLNVTRVLRLLGEEVTVLGFCAGSTGAWLRSETEKTGAVTRFIEVPGESRTNLNIIDRKNGRETEVLERGPVISPEAMVLFLEAFDTLMPEVSVLVLSGGLPQGLGPETYADLIRRASRWGVKCILDTSGPALGAGIAAGPWIVKPNLRELLSLTGGSGGETGDLVASALDLNRQGVRHVVPSMGGDGALWVSGPLLLKAETPRIEAVNTIGSGDSLVAGLAAGVRRGLSEAETLALAMACGVSNAEHSGIGYIDPLRVRQLAEEIAVRPMT